MKILSYRYLHDDYASVLHNDNNPNNWSSKSKSRSLWKNGQQRRLLALSALMLILQLSTTGTVNAAALGKERRETPNQRTIQLHNQSGRRVDVLWINRSVQPNTFISNSESGEGYPYGAQQGINSYIGHEFEVREMPSKKTGECRIPGDCKKGYFQVNEQEGQQLTIDKDFNVKHEDDRTIAQAQADALLDACEAQVKEKSLDPLQLVDAMTECMEQKVNETLAKQEEERNFQSQIRHQMANELVPYACGDVDFDTSIEVQNRSWNFQEVPGEEYRPFLMQIFHERPTSSIFQVPNFTTPEECRALKYFPSPEGAHIPFSTVNDRTKQGILVHSLASKFYEMARFALGWNDLEFQSQYTNHGEELLDIHKDTTGVTVLPTCTQEELEGIIKDDPKKKMPASCRLPGATHARVTTKHFVVEKPNQVATVFLFCDQDEASKLGGINFPDAGVHINRQPNLMVMAIHRSLDVPELDEFTTNYHFCPNYDIMTHKILVKEDTARTTSATDTSEQPSKKKEDDTRDDSSKNEL